MIRETFRCHSGILWNIEALKTIGLDADKLYPEVIVPPLGNCKPTSSPDIPVPCDFKEKEASDIDMIDPEHHDALSPLYDQLSLKPFWWALEVLPVKGKKQMPEPYDANTWEDITL